MEDSVYISIDNIFALITFLVCLSFSLILIGGLAINDESFVHRDRSIAESNIATNAINEISGSSIIITISGDDDGLIYNVVNSNNNPIGTFQNIEDLRLLDIIPRESTFIASYGYNVDGNIISVTYKEN